MGGLLLGGVNHCRLHCRLAKIRSLMYQVKYSAVIGLTKPIAQNLLLSTYTNVFLGQSQRRISPGTSNHGISPDDRVNYSG